MRKHITLFKLLTLATAIGLMSACGILSPIDSPQMKQYQIQAPNLQASRSNSEEKSTIEKSNKPFNLTLFVAPLTVDEPYNSTRMYYRENDYELLSYAQNLWAANPQQMLSKDILQALQHYRSFKNIVSSDFIGYADYRLTGNLNQLTQVIDGNNSNVILSVSYTLTDANSGRAISIKTFTLNQEASGNAQGFAKAANKLAQQLAKLLNNWLISQPIDEVRHKGTPKGT